MGARIQKEKEVVNCAVCRPGETAEGTVTLTLERGQTAVIVRGVPARVCNNCGEEYVDEDAATRVFTIAEEAAHQGIEVDVRQYVA